MELLLSQLMVQLNGSKRNEPELKPAGCSFYQTDLFLSFIKETNVGWPLLAVR